MEHKHILYAAGYSATAVNLYFVSLNFGRKKRRRMEEVYEGERKRINSKGTRNRK